MKLYKGLTLVTIGAVISGFEILSSALPGQAVTLSTSTGQVGNVDVSTGVFTPFINSGPAFTDIAVNDEGKLFGTTFNQLYSISQNAGSSTLIGNENQASNDINGLGFDKNNVLYATGVNGNFYSVNAATGAASLISKISNFSSIGDIVFDPTINQFLATSSSPTNSSLFSIAVNGVSTQIGSVGFPDVYGLAFNNGTLYGYTSDGKELVINATTGSGVFDKNVTGVSGQIFGAASSLNDTTTVSEPTTLVSTALASSINDTQSVPEPTTLASTALAILIGCWMKLKQKASQSA